MLSASIGPAHAGPWMSQHGSTSPALSSTSSSTRTLSGPAATDELGASLHRFLPCDRDDYSGFATTSFLGPAGPASHALKYAPPASRSRPCTAKAPNTVVHAYCEDASRSACATMPAPVTGSSARTGPHACAPQVAAPAPTVTGPHACAPASHMTKKQGQSGANNDRS
jgi:hypothetical protein